MAGTMQSEIGWAKVFLAFLKEAEMEADQIRMSGMGIRWAPAPTPHDGSALKEHFEKVDSARNPSPSSDRMAKAVGNRIVPNVK
jgi:hypothetical protein